MKFEIFIACFLLLSCTSCQKKDSKAETPAAGAVQCSTGALQSFGLKGPSTASAVRLEMCGFIESSCCVLEDQKVIFRHWKEEAEGPNLSGRLEFHMATYREVLKVVGKVEAFAKRLESRAPPGGNCQLLAKRIAEFKVDALRGKLLEAMEETRRFFEDSYRGFYCSLCDAKNQGFFDLAKKRFVVSEAFCHQLSSNTLHYLLYFHLHLPRLLNLLSRFVMGCSAAGVFKETPLDPKLVFSSDQPLGQLLEKCRDSLLKPGWLPACRPLCEKFSLIRFDPFFAPRSKAYRAFLPLVGIALKKIEVDEALLAAAPPSPPPMPALPAQLAGLPRGLWGADGAASVQELVAGIFKDDGYGRLLSEKKAEAKPKEADKPKDGDKVKDGDKAKAGDKAKDGDKAKAGDKAKDGDKAKGGDKAKDGDKAKKKEKKENKDYEDPAVFQTDLNAIVDFSGFATAVGDPGIELYLNGRQSIIDEFALKAANEAAKAGGGAGAEASKGKDGKEAKEAKDAKNVGKSAQTKGDSTTGVAVEQVAGILLAVVVFVF